MRAFITLMVFIILIILVSILFIHSGTYNIAATKPHTGIARWIFGTVMERSVKSRADRITVPPLDDDSLVRIGFITIRRCALPATVHLGLNPLK
jgi:hypothetical protein